MDPNASGLPLHSSIALGGRAPLAAASVDGFDLRARFADGANLYEYARSNPVSKTDPTGLLALDLIETGVMTVVGGLRGGLQEMVAQYAENQEFDLDWASDWSQGDDWHSRGSNSWVESAFARGMVRGAWEQLDPTGGMLDGDGGPSMASAAKVGRAGKAIKRANRALTGAVGEIGTYGELRKLTAGHGGEIQAHKLVEKRHLARLNVNIDNVPAVILTKDQHQKITNTLRQAHPYGKSSSPSREELLAVLKTAYADNPRWYQHAKKFLESINY